MTALRAMLLDFQRLFSSTLWALANNDEKVAALTLWGRSISQEPAGSLPSDERELAALSGAGKDWRKVRAMALRHWTKGDDGRLYHKVVSEYVGLALKGQAQTAKAREALRASGNRHRDRDRNSGQFARHNSGLFEATTGPPIDGSDRPQQAISSAEQQPSKGKGREGNPSTSSLRSEAAGSARAGAPDPAAADLKNETNGFHFLDDVSDVWNDRPASYGLVPVAELTERRADRARAMVEGVKAHGFDSDQAAIEFLFRKLDESFFTHGPKRPLTFDQFISPDFWPQLIEGAFDYVPPKRSRA